MMHQIKKLWLVAALPLLSFTGCHLVLGPDEGNQEWWYYCDNSGCYRCNVDYCEISGDHCNDNYDCPQGSYCADPDWVCRTKPGCKVTADCGTGFVCKGGKCLPGEFPCKDHSDCGDGAYCTNGTCKNSGTCSKNEDCSKVGPDLVCDPRGSCVPGKPPIKTCKTGSECPGGLCVDGQCGVCSSDCGGGTTCQFTKHCGAGRLCLDGQCTDSCTTSKDCGSGKVCKSKVCAPGTTGACVTGGDCGSGKVCLNGICLPDCSSAGQCGSSLDICTGAVAVGDSLVKVCKANHKAKPECAVNKDCTGGELCVNGVCRTSCVKTADCAVCEDGPVCGTGGFCMTSAESSPQCSKNSDCTGGKFCLGAQCISL